VDEEHFVGNVQEMLLESIRGPYRELRLEKHDELLKRKAEEDDEAKARRRGMFEIESKEREEAAMEKFRLENEEWKLKDLKTKEETEQEDEERQKMALFGFQENQIEAVLHPKEASSAQQGLQSHPQRTLDWRAQAPTYIKVHKTHVEFETLKYFGLPWEYDAVSTLPHYLLKNTWYQKLISTTEGFKLHHNSSRNGHPRGGTTL
jgi:hypothetical protein